MPELPEVETVRIGLNKLLPSLKVEAVTSDWAKSFPNAVDDVDQFLIGADIVQVKRRAKVLMIELSTGYSLVIHLKMTGQLVYVQSQPTVKLIPNLHLPPPDTVESHKVEGRKSNISHLPSPNHEVRFGAGHPNDSLVGRLPDRSTRVIFSLSNGARLYFNDQRKFGWVRLIPTSEKPNIDFFKKVGPEPLSDDFTAKDFRLRLIRRKNSNIKAVLLDQTVIAGVGNIYADESLWGAKIHPTTLVKDLSIRQINKLYLELRAVLNLSIAQGGSSDKNYVNAEGKKGSYLNFAKVFRREGLPCPRCGTVIIKTRVAGRGTHTCPYCQKI